MLLIEKKYFDGIINDLELKVNGGYYVRNSQAHWDAMNKLLTYKFLRNVCVDLSSFKSRIKLCYNILFKKIKK